MALNLFSTPAHASLTFCNRTSYILNAATAAQGSTDVVSKGWTRLTPGACAVAITGDLTAQAYYIYGRSSLAHSGTQRSWGGRQSVCVKDDNFTISTVVNTPGCRDDGAFELPFALLNTNHMTSWTMTFSESPMLATMAQARLAGIERLLNDTGYHTPIDGRPGSQQAAMLAAFERRMHLSKASGDAGLFDALETAALKNAVPEGYSVCNDTAKPVIAALGHSEKGTWQSHGWWPIAPGACARLVTTRLATDAYYLYVQHAGGAPIVKGPETFCTAKIEFDIQDRRNCTARGLTATGFLKTPVAGVAGYVAHVAENGLVPRQAPTSK
ncbi:MAG TPA: DUF1036 domain-containing protein [Rhizomicrobium sp.]|nr:DUF1036 domain-containing protein [Rhizomicrobium sp.]